MNFFLPISMKVSRGIYELFGTNDMGKAGLSEPGDRGANATPPDFCRLVYHISTRRTVFVHHVTICPLGFSDLPTALLAILCRAKTLYGTAIDAKTQFFIAAFYL